MRSITFFSILMITGALSSCKRETEPAAKNPTGVTVDYLVDEETDFSPVDDANARTANATSGKLTFQVRQEGEIFRDNNSFKLFKMATDPTNDPAAMATAIAGKTATYTVQMPGTTNLRSYTRKTLPIGWYVIQYQDSGQLLMREEVTAGTNALVNMDDNSGFGSPFTGIFPNYGKVKVSLWYGYYKPTQAVFTATDSQNRPTAYVIYSEDATGSKKGLTWFMPSGTYGYNATCYDASQPINGTMIVGGLKYPNLKLTWAQ